MNIVNSTSSVTTGTDAFIHNGARQSGGAFNARSLRGEALEKCARDAASTPPRRAVRREGREALGGPAAAPLAGVTH